MSMKLVIEFCCLLKNHAMKFIESFVSCTTSFVYERLTCRSYIFIISIILTTFGSSDEIMLLKFMLRIFFRKMSSYKNIVVKPVHITPQFKGTRSLCKFCFASLFFLLG